MEERGIHYRTGGKLTHAGCEMLPEGKDIEYIIIERIEFKDSENVGGRIEEGIWVAYFAPNSYTKLPMVLNATNRKRIAKLYPEVKGHINLLRNIPVRLTQEKTKDIRDGGETYGLRISKVPAKAPKKPTLTSTSSKWNDCVEWVKQGNTAESLRQWYEISDAVIAQLNQTKQTSQTSQ